MPVQQVCKIVEMTQLDADTWWMVLEAGKLVEQHGLRGGQFLHIKCGDNQLLRRPISVARTQCGDPEDTAALIFEVRGEGTRWLSQRRVGEKLDVLGPLGNGFDVSRKGRYLLVGLGECLSWPRTAVLGFRTGAKAFLPVISRFAVHCEKTYLCTDDGSLGRHGLVDTQVRDVLAKDSSFTAVLACGPKPMLKSVAKAAAEFGIPCQVSMGCALPMKDGSIKHVCKDGPVFDAREVDWDA